MTSAPPRHDIDKPGKSESQHQHLPVPLQNSFRPSTDDNNGSIYSAENGNERQRGRLLGPAVFRHHSASPAVTARSWKARCNALWLANKGLVLVLVSQFFGALMNVTTRLLETSEHPLNTFQVMFVRMLITSILCTLYMWWAEVEHFPLGHKSVRKLLMARGFGGFFGLLGIYYSLQYLPLAEATVITFLAPIVACWACSVLIHEPFTRIEQIAGFVSLAGVVLIARPASFFSLDAAETPNAIAIDDAMLAANATGGSEPTNVDQVTSSQRLVAVAVALVGVFGAASAYTTIRMIGQRAHPLISVNYFAAWSTLVAFVVLLFVPGMDFQLPSGLKQWGYLGFLGVCGFVMQILLTTGLSYEKSSRATNMVYTNMLFALAFDKIVFDTTMETLSIIGSSLILGSALCVAVSQDPSRKTKMDERRAEDEEEKPVLSRALAGNNLTVAPGGPSSTFLDYTEASSMLRLYLTAFISLLSVALAVDETSQSDNGVTWLYPSLAAPSLAYNTLDTVNVTWISTYTPAFLKLTCQQDSFYTSILELPVPATGNRLISLMTVASTASSLSTSYQSCRFELSAPVSQSVSFNLTAISTQDPAFWSLDSSTFSSSSAEFNEQQARARAAQCSNKNTSTSAIAAIGVGVAVGVFALTTACFVLYEVQRRTKRQSAAAGIEGHDGGHDGGGEGHRMSEPDPAAGKWIAKTLKGGGAGGAAGGGATEATEPRPKGTTNDFTHIKRSHEMQIQRSHEFDGTAGRGEQRQAERMYEVNQEPVELESPLGGRYA
ncbi:MAG: hypothetical protein Q9168_001146 [Polycauliona sp. 1 TL-2023]